MDKESIKEIRGRTLRQRSQDAENAIAGKIYPKLIRLYMSTHYVVNGRKKKYNDREKEKRANAMIDKAYQGEIDITEDVRDQIKLMDSD